MVLMKLLNGVLLLLFFTLSLGDQNISIIHKKCSATCNPKYCNVTTVCRPFNRTATSNSFDINFHPGIIIQAPIQIDINAYKKFANQYRPFMFKLSDELCGYLVTKNHPMFRFDETNSSTNSNLLDPCPIRGHRYFNNPRGSDYSIWPLIPTGEWRLEVILYKNIKGVKESIVSWLDYYEVSPTNAIQF